MTDRQVGGEGLNVDLNAQTDRRVASEQLTVDVVPLLVERRVGALRANVDYTFPQGVQFGAVGMLVDCIVSLVPSNAARWSGMAFEMGTASPLSYWSGSQFLASGTTPVLWVTDHFEVAP